MCGANRSVPKPIMFKGDGAGIDDEEDKLFCVFCVVFFFFRMGTASNKTLDFKMASISNICILVIIVFHICTYSGLCSQYIH